MLELMIARSPRVFFHGIGGVLLVSHPQSSGANLIFAI